MSGIGIVGRGEGICYNGNAMMVEDSSINQSINPCVNSPEHQLALTALGSTKE